MAHRASTHPYASVRFISKVLDPDDVTRTIWLRPDHVNHKAGLWSFSSEGCVNVPELNEHLNWLLRLLEFRKEAVATLLAQGVRAELLCYSRGSTVRKPSLSREIRRRAAALGIAIGIDHSQQ